MGSSYSDLYLYFALKDGNYVFPKDGQTSNGGPKNGGRDNKNQIFSVEVKKENYQGCVNFEKVTHSITFTPPNKGTNYNVLLYDGDEKDKGKNVFGYYYPSNDKEVLKQLHVYYSVIAPNDPLVVSFVTRGNQTHNFLYSGLISTRWVRAYSIAYYSLGKDVSSELLTNEFRKSHRNRKIKFETGTKVEEVSGFKQKLDNDKIYRYIYYPSGNTSVLGSECISKINTETSKTLECPESQDASKPSETPKPEGSSSTATATQAKSPPNYDNKIDPYYLDIVNGHYYDGVILYFVKNGNQEKKPGTSENNNSGGGGSNGQSGSSPQGNSATSNASGQGNSEKYDHNMAVLLELINNCNTKTHIKRKDKHGNWWTQEQVKYNTDKELIKELNEIKESADTNDSTTFILEKTSSYKGVEVKSNETNHLTFKKYTHSAKSTNKTNLLFKKKGTKISDFESFNLKTQTLDIYFLKIGDKEEDWPFILMFTTVDEKAAEAAPAVPPAPPPPPGTASGPKTCKKCYFSSENYDFTKWQELTVDKKEAEPSEEKKPTEKKTQEPEKDPGEELKKKLEARLTKIEEYGKCQTELYLLRKVAYYVLSTDEVDTEKIEEIKKEERPKVQHFIQKGTGTSLPVVLGSVAAGLVVLGIISAIIYGIYWYNTTIKLLT